jgi:hypothetical protein
MSQPSSSPTGVPALPNPPATVARMGYPCVARPRRHPGNPANAAFRSFTLTACYYPYTLAEHNDTDYHWWYPDKCTRTYAEVYGFALDLVSSLLIVESLMVLLLTMYRLQRLSEAARQTNRKLSEMPTFWYFANCAVCCVTIFVSMFDFQGARGWYPPWVFFILTNVTIASIFSGAMCLVDFWVRISRGFGKSSQGLSAREKFGFMLLLYVSSLLWAILGLVDIWHYEIYSAVWYLTLVSVSFWLIFVARRAVNGMLRTLSTARHLEDRQSSSAKDKASKVLARKFRIFIFFTLLGMFLLSSVAVLNLRGVDTLPRSHIDVDWAWTIPVDQGFSIVQIVLLIIYMLVLYTGATFFRATSTKPSSSSNQTPTAGTGKDGLPGAASGPSSSMHASLRSRAVVSTLEVQVHSASS